MALVPAGMTEAVKLPSPLPRRIVTSFDAKLATARSGCPSPFRLPAAMEIGWSPATTVGCVAGIRSPRADPASSAESASDVTATAANAGARRVDQDGETSIPSGVGRSSGSCRCVSVWSRSGALSRCREPVEGKSGPFLYSCAGPLAQLVEQGTFNPKVVGSIPTRPTALSLTGRPRRRGGGGATWLPRAGRRRGSGPWSGTGRRARPRRLRCCRRRSRSGRRSGRAR